MSKKDKRDFFSQTFRELGLKVQRVRVVKNVLDRYVKPRL